MAQSKCVFLKIGEAFFLIPVVTTTPGVWDIDIELCSDEKRVGNYLQVAEIAKKVAILHGN